MENREMDLINFENWLKQIKNKKGKVYTIKSIATRIKNLKKVEEKLGDVDKCVENEDSMYDALMSLEKLDVPEHQHLQTSLRRYWEFKKNSEFPTKKQYRKLHNIK